jgi:hypothetical protein
LLISSFAHLFINQLIAKSANPLINFHDPVSFAVKALENIVLVEIPDEVGTVLGGDMDDGAIEMVDHIIVLRLE